MPTPDFVFASLLGVGRREGALSCKCLWVLAQCNMYVFTYVCMYVCIYVCMYGMYVCIVNDIITLAFLLL